MYRPDHFIIVFAFTDLSMWVCLLAPFDLFNLLIFILLLRIAIKCSIVSTKPGPCSFAYCKKREGEGEREGKGEES